VEPLREDWTSKPICLIDVEEVSMEKIDEFEGDVLADNGKRSGKFSRHDQLFDGKYIPDRLKTSSHLPTFYLMTRFSRRGS